MTANNGPARCRWANTKNQLYIDYHDNEWGEESRDDHHLFEMLILESFQAGLSWECVLNKRAAFRKAFDDFDIDKVRQYDDEKNPNSCKTPGLSETGLR